MMTCDTRLTPPYQTLPFIMHIVSAQIADGFADVALWTVASQAGAA